MCLKSAQDCVHGAHAGRRWNRLGGHTGGGSGGGPVSKLLPLADVGGGAKDGQVVVIQLWSEMERGPHLVRCAGLLLLLAGVGAQKKLLEKVLKKTTTLKPRLLQTSDGKHCRSSPDVATRSLGLNVNDKSMKIQGANFMRIMSCNWFSQRYPFVNIRSLYRNYWLLHFPPDLAPAPINQIFPIIDSVATFAVFYTICLEIGYWFLLYRSRKV